MPTPFEIIEQYCTRNRKSTCTRDLAYSVYCLQYETLAKDPTLTPAAINTILLSDTSVIAHVRSAEDTLSKHVEDELKRLKKELGAKSFGMSIVSGVVGNLVYSLLLVLVFVLAKDQIASWLSSVSQGTP
ncbi:hypothetical protein [Pseudomonas moraviensis]|uniref:hypothetical protein n=1 Tax=Pseudomonas moraviensis TaxID=321662 RepID=UPI001059760F|nr:hypothetical protein [Pseudomonas moraviensis]TDK53837.1 hypothetical protein E1508_16540 [Pseudomonas moraviensis]